MRQQLEGKRGEPAAKLFNVKVFPLLALQQLVFSYLCCVHLSIWFVNRFNASIFCLALIHVENAKQNASVFYCPIFFSCRIARYQLHQVDFKSRSSDATKASTKAGEKAATISWQRWRSRFWRSAKNLRRSVVQRRPLQDPPGVCSGKNIAPNKAPSL